MMTARKALSLAKKRLMRVDVPESYAKYVLNELYLKKELNLYEHLDLEMDEDLALDFEAKIERLEKDEPLAYVMGIQYFYGYPFEVNPSVLIPRYETEELVLRVIMEIDEHFEDKSVSVLDIGTGSGAIACVLKKEIEHSTVYASDISKEALIQAKKNAQMLEAEVTFLEGDMAQPFVDEKILADVLVCNPPYIPQDEVIENSVKAYEPHVALFGGQDGLYFYRKVLEKAHLILKPRSIMAFEMGWDQRITLTHLVHEYFPKADVECIQDLNHKDRILIVRQL